MSVLKPATQRIADAARQRRSGANRAHETAVATLIGAVLKRPDAADVRAIIGYAIGGRPTLSHATPLSVV